SEPLVTTLVFSPDNMCNTTVFEGGDIAYTVTTDASGKMPVTRVCDGEGRCVADWVWREPRSDLLTLHGIGWPQGPASAWLKKSLIPFNDSVTFQDEAGRKFVWTNTTPGPAPQLHAHGSKSPPIARFQRSHPDRSSTKTPAHVSPAKLVLDARADEIRDLVLVSFLLIERRRREADVESANRASA
ncbi:hypothetical protein DENSPDRAFT_745194, partial [Dentipellis sp. KUC8613]